ncbi:MAG: erythromycin esterase family protein [Chlorobi bacterium]|nr:erythromycin esterase family protein [Chlorobiota bacterium]
MNYRLFLFVALAATLASSCAKTQPSESRAFIEWVSKNAIAVESYDSPLPGEELASLRKAIGPARVVGMGESRHDTREQLLLKGLLVRHLIEDLGFRALILEESFPHAEALDRYVASGEGDLREIMNRLAGWYLWDTEEMLDLVRWIRQFNEGCEPGRKVRVFGMDITAPAPGVQSVLDFLHGSGTGTQLNAKALGLDLQRGDFWPDTWKRYAALSDERRRELSDNYDVLVETLKLEKAKLVDSSSGKEFERMLLLAEIGRSGNALFSSANREEGGAVRERGMVETILWILDREIAGEKAIIWSHNLHVSKSTFRMPGLAEGTLQPMGVQLSEELGDAYVAIGGTFGKGSYSADLPPGEREFAEVSEDVMDGALGKVGEPVFLIDLRGAEADSAANEWLQEEREWRAQDSRAVQVPGAAFDLVYFVRNVSRSHPTPLALRRFQSQGEQH